MVKVYDAVSGKKFDCMTSEGMLDAFVSNGGKYKDLVQKGSAVSVTAEKHLGTDLYPEEKATSYEKDGEVKLHSRTGYSIREVLPMGQFQMSRFNMMNAEQAKVDVQLNNLDKTVSAKMAILQAKGFDAETAAKLALGVLA